jgi:hypothetical protein
MEGFISMLFGVSMMQFTISTTGFLSFNEDAAGEGKVKLSMAKVGCLSKCMECDSS